MRVYKKEMERELSLYYSVCILELMFWINYKNILLIYEKVNFFEIVKLDKKYLAFNQIKNYQFL